MRCVEAAEIGDGLAKCRTCGEVRKLPDFDVRADTGKPKTQCKACRRRYQRQRWPRSTTERPARVFDQAKSFTCTRCGEIKPASEFPPRLTGSRQLQSWCRGCFRAHNARNYAANRDRERARIRRNRRAMRAENRRRLDEYLLEHPCIDCGETDILVLDFDHLRDKRQNVSEMLHLSWAVIAEEIAKCEVRCANDHRRVTHRRRAAQATSVRPGRGSNPRPVDS